MPSRIVEPSAMDTITMNPAMAFITFPPFPEPPPGVTIIPFKDFKARGIQLFSESAGDMDNEDMELDGLGIPTVELRVKHSTDECKSNARKRKRKKKTIGVEGVPPKKLPWYEEWEEGEDLRVTKCNFDSYMSAVDRFFHAANDFRVNRTWPPTASGVSQLWDQFRLYVGLLANPTVYRKPAKLEGAQDGSSNDNGDGDNKSNIQAESDPSGQVPSSKDHALSSYSVELGDDDDDDEDTFRVPKTETEEQREEKLIMFLSDPEKSVTIFLSSYMRERGLIWSERNLINAPHLLSFFLNFILRNRVLQRASHESGIRRALDIVELAKKELPLTYKIGQAVPDGFSDGCKECFGRKGGIEWTSDNAPRADDSTTPADQTITVTDQDGAETEIVLPDTLETALKDAIEDNVDMEIQVTGATTAPIATANSTFSTPIDAIATASPDILSADTADTAVGRWGTVDGTDYWGNVGDNNWTVNDDGGWGHASDNEEWGADSAPFSFAPEETEPSWLSPPPSLTSIMGPTTLPLTHTTGIVESSTRRIKAIHPPPKDKAKVKGDSAEMVEDELERRFGRVVMSPWGREEFDIPSPIIRKTSRGVVVMPGGEVDGSGSRKPHNPYEDDIVLVVEPAILNRLSIGMGLGGLWVQIVREEMEIDLASDQAQQKSRGKRSKKGKGPLDELSGNYWYLEELMGTFPSYFTSMENGK